MLGWAFVISSVTCNLIATLHKDDIPHYSAKLTTAKNLADLYYVSHIEGTEIDTNAACDAFGKQKINNLNDLFYATKYLKSKAGAECSATIEEYYHLAADALEQPKNMKDLYQAVVVESDRQIELNNEEIVEKLAELAKDDDSVLAGSLAISAGVHLWQADNTVSLDSILKIAEIEDLFAQADSFEKQLSFDNDVAVTYFFVKAALDISEYKNVLVLSHDQLIGFGNFIASGFRPSNNHEVYYFLKLAAALNNQRWGKLIQVDLASRRPYHENNRNIAVVVNDLLGLPVKASVTARSITRVEDNEVVLSNEKLSASPGSDGYVYNFMSSSPAAGFYELELDVSGEGLIVTDDAIRYKIKVVQPVKLENLQNLIGTKKLGSKMKYTAGNFAEGTSTDQAGKLGASFTVVANDKNIKVHQAFLLIKNKVSGETTILIAEADEKLVYTASLDVKDHLEYGGVYELSVSVGDPIMHPGMITSSLGEVTITGSPESKSEVLWSRKFLEKYDMLKLLSHTFREPEPRPPVLISLVFTGLCAVPLAVLCIVWRQMGLNFNKIQSSYLPFHAAIGSIFGLYFLYWYKLDMFTTLKYLALLGSVTFILGNKVLSTLASTEK